MIKALFFDLDGTLLNSKKEISERTQSTLKICKLKGIKLFIATARPPLLKKMLAWDDTILSLFDGGSYYNGGCIILHNTTNFYRKFVGKRSLHAAKRYVLPSYSPLSCFARKMKQGFIRHKILFCDGGQYINNTTKQYIPIDNEVVQGIIELVSKYELLNIALQLEDEVHAFRFPLEEKEYKSWGINLEDSLNIKNINGYRTIKILVFYANLINSATQIDTELVSQLKSMYQNKAQLYLTDEGKLVQIIGASVNKYESIEKIRLRYGFQKNEIAVFGDDVNDIEMLSAYDNSVAMGNADDYIKKVAKYTTLDNNNDGIHHAICNILRII